jgi:hypothetical protein
MGKDGPAKTISGKNPNLLQEKEVKLKPGPG